MKPLFFHQTDLFIPALVLSVSTHLIIFSLGNCIPLIPQMAVEDAPSSLEVHYVKDEMMAGVKIVLPKVEVVALADVDVMNTKRIFPETTVNFSMLTKIQKPRVHEIDSGVESRRVLPELGINFDEEIPLERNATLGGNTHSVQSNALKGAQGEALPLNYLNSAPVYPKIARKRGWAGMVILKVLVTVEGLVGEVQVIQSSGYEVLNEAALLTVRNWKFSPAQSGALKFSSYILIPIQFRLANE